MLGVPRDEVDEVLERAKEDFRIAGFEEEEKRQRQRIPDRLGASLKLPQGPYIFCDFRTLHLPGIEVFLSQILVLLSPFFIYNELGVLV